MAEKGPQQENPEQKRMEQIQEQIGRKQEELQSIMGEYSALAQRMQALQERAQGGDEGAARELQRLSIELKAIQRRALVVLEEIRRLFKDMGQEERFFESQLGELYENFQSALEG